MGVSYVREHRIATITIDDRTDLNLMAPDTVYLMADRRCKSLGC